MTVASLVLGALIVSILQDIVDVPAITDPSFLYWTNEWHDIPFEARISLAVLLSCGTISTFIARLTGDDQPPLYTVEETAIRAAIPYGWGITRLDDGWLALGPDREKRNLPDLNDLEDFITQLEAEHA